MKDLKRGLILVLVPLVYTMGSLGSIFSLCIHEAYALAVAEVIVCAFAFKPMFDLWNRSQK